MRVKTNVCNYVNYIFVVAIGLSERRVDGKRSRRDEADASLGDKSSKSRSARDSGRQPRRRGLKEV